MSGPDRTYLSHETVGALFSCHRQDRPACPAESLAMTETGFRCRTCGWFVAPAGSCGQPEAEPDLSGSTEGASDGR